MKLADKESKALVKTMLKEHFKDQPVEQAQYERALVWRACFAERGMKLKNKFIPDTFVKPGER